MLFLLVLHTYTDIHGHEVADQLTKEGSKKQQPKSKLSYQEAKTLIRNKWLADFKHRNGDYNPQEDTLRLLSRHEQTTVDCVATWKRLDLKSQPFAPADWKHNPRPAVMPSPQKRNHLANRKFPRKQTAWNRHPPTPDGAVHRLDGTTNITSLHWTLEKKWRVNSKCAMSVSCLNVF